jgi:hypothetical protein
MMDLVGNPKYPTLPRVRAVKVLSGFCVHLTFADGLEKEIDLESHLLGPIFEPIRRDPQLFAAVQIDEAGDTICWPNGADIAPETLYYDGAPPWAADMEKPARRAIRPPRKSVRKTKTRARRARARA